MDSKHDAYLTALEALSDNYHFKVFMERIRALREDTIQEAIGIEIIGNELKSAALLGAIKTYQDILNEYDSYAPQSVD